MTPQESCGADDLDLARAIAWSCDLQVDSDAASDPRQNPAARSGGAVGEKTEFAGDRFFRRSFDLRYHLQRTPRFPLMALGRWLLRGKMTSRTAALVSIGEGGIAP